MLFLWNYSSHIDCKTCRTMPSEKSQCRNCNRMGHYAIVCRNTKELKEVDAVNAEESGSQEELEMYNINIFQVTTNHDEKHMKNDFKVQVIVNNRLHTVLAGTGASISVCGRIRVNKLIHYKTNHNIFV